MAAVKVALGSRSYSVHVISGGLDRLGSLLSRCYETGRCALVSSPRIFKLHGPKALRSLKRAGWKVDTFITPDGERVKTPAQVTSLHNRFAEARLERGHPIVVMAGGTLGDMAGYAAATYLRGVPLVHVPTTLMAQVDSAIGGKTGVNLPRGKNLVGAFHQPGLVLCDPEALSTLPDREFRSGLAEVVKYGCIANPRLLSRVESALSRDRFPGPAELNRWIVECVRIKAYVVSSDEREGGLRRILNFGHTFGHALEKTQGYGKLLHGEAVALGMAVALHLSRQAGLPSSTAQRVIELLKHAFPRLRFPGISWSTLSRAIAADKKTSHSRTVWIVLNQPAQPEFVRPTDSAVRKAIEQARRAWA